MSLFLGKGQYFLNGILTARGCRLEYIDGGDSHGGLDCSFKAGVADSEPLKSIDGYNWSAPILEGS